MNTKVKSYLRATPLRLRVVSNSTYNKYKLVFNFCDQKKETDILTGREVELGKVKMSLKLRATFLK